MSGLGRGIDPTPSQLISAIFHFIRAEKLELEIQKLQRDLLTPEEIAPDHQTSHLQ